jgi:hypothetical protein
VRWRIIFLRNSGSKETETEPTSLGKSEKLQYYFCAQFRLQKVLLLVWKVLMIRWVLGGTSVLFLCSVSHEESAAAAVESAADQLWL